MLMLASCAGIVSLGILFSRLGFLFLFIVPDSIQVYYCGCCVFMYYYGFLFYSIVICTHLPSRCR
ncbi:hypothetical protein OIU79_030359 [Salix purpurea]|uniref:Uncharacterized protein n=1 Tax=Salix purpurea TaxID=77065 RepID=A0A9Q0ZRB9_SALPP|nr:hypothetical protein OIU79_030359 [Salix purpurea]